MKTTALVPAAGRGVRMGEATPKPFLLLGGRPVLQHTLARLAQHRAIDDIIVLVAADWVDVTRRDIVERYGLAKVTAVLEGGAERFDTVARGLERIDDQVHLVLVHDGVRPFVSPDLIDATITMAASHGAAIAALPISDCVKRARDDGSVQQTIERNKLWRAQTPQVFHRELLQRAVAHSKRRHRFSFDEAQLVEALGVRVQLVPGSALNMKITLPEDLTLAQAILRLGDASLASQPVLR